jgi:diaminohydroxyphosphoribosylaminopyrimidine deaminase/5-amino-6-(5-phosphoribosylamino)uracil reductase
MRSERDLMKLALRLARRGYGMTSPNPMVGAVLVKGGEIIGQGWHHRAGEPHAEIEAIRDAQGQGRSTRGATLCVTLEPCCTHGRTPPCTDAILAAGISRVLIGATDPNPRHRGRAFKILERQGIIVKSQVLEDECQRLNESFNQWIVHHTPFVTVKAAMTLDGKIATASGESKWITAEAARAYAMKLRQGADAILVGINTILADDPSLTSRPARRPKSGAGIHRLRRIILDATARTPLGTKVVTDEHADMTTIVVGESAPKRRIAALARKVRVLVAPVSGKPPPASRTRPHLDLAWLLSRLGSEDVTSLLVEGGGEVNASFLFQNLAHRIAFFYAPKILGGRDSRRGVAGDGATCLKDSLALREVEWQRLGPDWLLTARLSH